MKIGMNVAVVVMGTIALCAARAGGAVVYESSGGTRPFQISDQGIIEVGDHVFLEGEDRRLAGAVVPFNTFSNRNDPNDPNDTFTPAYQPALLRLTLYRNRAGAPDDVIGSSTVPGPAFPEGGNSADGGTDVLFPFANLEVPEAFLFAVSQLKADGTPEDAVPTWLGVYLSAEAFPEVGRSDDTFAYRTSDGWTEADLALPPVQVDATFLSAVPEPGAVGPLVLALAAAACRRGRRRRTTPDDGGRASRS